MNRKIRKIFTLPVSDTLLFTEAFSFQLIVGLLVKVIPFKRIPGLFSGRQHPGLQYDASDNDLLHATLEHVKTATMRAGSVCPWKNKCLVQSLAARWMLNRRKIKSQLSLGVAFGLRKEIKAHAWLKSGDYELVAKKGNFQELYHF